jgi:hypothetical protein
VLEKPGWVPAATITPALIIWQIHNCFLARETKIEYEITTYQKYRYDLRLVSVVSDPRSFGKRVVEELLSRSTKGRKILNLEKLLDAHRQSVTAIFTIFLITNTKIVQLTPKTKYT